MVLHHGQEDAAAAAAVLRLSPSHVQVRVSAYHHTTVPTAYRKRRLRSCACRFHLGSIAFGSLIIAIVQFIRLCLEYLDHKTKAMQVRRAPSLVWARACVLARATKSCRSCLHLTVVSLRGVYAGEEQVLGGHVQGRPVLPLVLREVPQVHHVRGSRCSRPHRHEACVALYCVFLVVRFCFRPVIVIIVVVGVGIAVAVVVVVVVVVVVIVVHHCDCRCCAASSRTSS